MSVSPPTPSMKPSPRRLMTSFWALATSFDELNEESSYSLPEDARRRVPVLSIWATSNVGNSGAGVGGEAVKDASGEVWGVQAGVI